MNEDKNASQYDDLGEAAREFAGQEDQPDFLTDPAADAAASDEMENERYADHRVDLRAAREKGGFSLEEIAEKTAIPRETLAQAEEGQDILPLGQLIRLSKALSLRMEDLISKGLEEFTIVRADSRESFKRYGKEKMESSGYEYESLAPRKKDRKMEPFIVTLLPASSDEPSSHDGQEFIYVLEGEMEVQVEGTRDVLRAGDAIYYDSTSTHLVRAHGDKPARILAVLID